MRTWLSACLAVLVGACSPTLDWRELRPQGIGAAFVLPCRPDQQSRKVRLAGAMPVLTLHVCSAGDVTWALAMADLVDPARVTPALTELGSAAVANLGATDVVTLPLVVPGATPNPASVRLTLRGQLPDGRPVEEQVALFAIGTRVYQATCLGARLPPQAVETFFAGLRALP